MNAVQTVQSRLRASLQSAAACSPVPYPEFSGLLLSDLDGNIYIIDPEGFRRHIPDPPTFNNLFGSSAKVETEPLLSVIADGEPMDSGAVLFKGDANPALFVTDHGLKRWIVSPEVGAKYQFFGTVNVIAQMIADGVPQGANWAP